MTDSTTNRQNHLAAFRTDARQCIRCRELGLIHREPDGRWAYPLFHEDSECSTGILFVAEAPNWDDTFHPDKGRIWGC